MYPLNTITLLAVLQGIDIHPEPHTGTLSETDCPAVILTSLLTFPCSWHKNPSLLAALLV